MAQGQGRTLLSDGRRRGRRALYEVDVFPGDWNNPLVREVPWPLVMDGDSGRDDQRSGLSQQTWTRLHGKAFASQAKPKSNDPVLTDQSGPQPLAG